MTLQSSPTGRKLVHTLSPGINLFQLMLSWGCVGAVLEVYWGHAGGVLGV